MPHRLYLLRRKVEQPTGLDHLESLIHQSRRVDSDARPHLPCWMIQGLLGSHFRESLGWSLPEWPSRCGQNELRDLIAPSRSEALVCAIVFAIYGKQFTTGSPHRFNHHLAARNQRLLISEPDALAEPDCLISGFHPLHPNNRRHYESCFSRSGGVNASLRAESELRDIGAKPRTQIFKSYFVSHYSHLRTKLGNLLCQKFGVAPRDEGKDAKPVRPTPHHV